MTFEGRSQDRRFDRRRGGRVIHQPASERTSPGNTCCTALAIAAAFILMGCATPDNWTRDDTRWQQGTTASIAADSLSTAYALRRGCNEDNPLLGRYPSDGVLLLAGAVGSVTNYLVAKHIKRPRWRRAWQITFVVLHSSLAIRNTRIHCNG